MPSLPSPLPLKTPSSSRSTSRSRSGGPGKTNKKAAEAKNLAKSASATDIIAGPPTVPDLGSARSRGSRPSNDGHLPPDPAMQRSYSTNAITGTVKLLQPTSRRNQMCTYSHPTVPSPNDWQSETQASLGKGSYHHNYAYLDEMRDKEEFIKGENEKIMFNKARRCLSDLAQKKFGSVKNMFKMFDYDGNGTVTLEEFSRGLKRRNLEPLFGREQQRVLFQHIDTNYNNELDIAEFMTFLTGGGGETSRSTSSKLGRPPANPNKKPAKMHPAVQRVKDMIVDRLVARRRSQKMDDGQKVNSEFLIQTFKQWDEGMSGFLTPDEFSSAMGERHLNLGISQSDMTRVLSELDADHNGEISYKEFAKFLQVHDIDPEYNPFFDSRQRAMNSLHKISSKPWKWQKETDTAIHFQAQREREIDTDVEMSKTMNLQAAAFEASTNVDVGDNMFHKERPNTVAGARRGGGPRSGKSRKLKKLNSSGELFTEMREKNEEELSNICPRFRKMPPTDWNRLGMGRGVDPNATAYYQDIRDSTTATEEYYPPVHYVPNQPIQRDLVSDSSKGFYEKEANAARRKTRTDDNFRIIMERVKMEETMQKMNEDQKLREKSGAMLGYFKKIYAAEEKKAKKGGIGMTMKKHPAFAHRMWGGDKNSPFHVNNLNHHTVDFTKTSTDYGAHHHISRGRVGSSGGKSGTADVAAKQSDPGLKAMASMFAG